ncbi:MAG: ArsR family transcriptional regulator [Bdellovibrionota bacterium]
MNELSLDERIAILKSLADATRLHLVNALLEKPHCVEDLAERLRRSPSTISFHLRLLEEARELANRLGNESVSNSIAVSVELHSAEFGLSGAEGVASLERRLAAVGTEDNYSSANVGLELARQYTRQGRVLDAAKALESVAPSIYANQNRRQEITLNLRLAELAFQRGDFFGARHYLHFLDRLLHREVDATFELAALGLSRKLLLAEGKSAEAPLARWKELSQDFGTTRDDNLQVRLSLLGPERENQEDRVHRVLQSSRLLADPADRLRPLLEQGLLCDASAAAGLPAAGRAALAVLPQSLGQLSRDAGGIEWVSSPLSSLQAKILRLVSQGGGCDKATLVEKAWGYRYDPLRHDAMVYSALSALRRSLGKAAHWIQATEAGYSFSALVLWPVMPPARAVKPAAAEKNSVPTSESPEASIDESLLPHLNHRQIEILEWMRGHRFLAVGECRIRFDVSEITALRDLDGLRRHGLVVRSGKARATRYSLAEPGVTQ